MNQKKVLTISSILLLAALIGAVVWFTIYRQNSTKVTSYEECAAAGYPILETSPEQCRLPDGTTYTRKTDSKIAITLAGTLVCLPHKNTEGPHTMECAMGIKANSGDYYGIGSEPYDATLSEVGREVTVTGTLKDETRSQYNSKGIITVESHTFID